MAEPPWDGQRHAAEKRGFIASRLHGRSVKLHTALIFALTWGAGWLASAGLLRLGWTHMAGRYALAFALSYAVFFLCVRVWASQMRSARGSEDLGGWDLPASDPDGCLMALGMLLLGAAAATAFALVGGPALLLEVAFEVVFAGVLVKRLGRLEPVGNWAGLLWRKTALAALVLGIGLVLLAAELQRRTPEAHTFAQAVVQLWQGR